MFILFFDLMKPITWITITMGIVGLVLVVTGAFNYGTDPTGRWGTRVFSLRDMKGIGAPEFKLGGFRRSDSTVVVMGSSRVVFLEWPEQIEGEPIHVLAFGDANLTQMAEQLRVALATGRVKRLYLGLDFLGGVRGLDERPRRWMERRVADLNSWWHYRTTIMSLGLWRRPADWAEKADQLVDMRTGRTLRNRRILAEGYDELVLDFYRSRIGEVRGILAEEGVERATALLAGLVAEAEVAGVEVRLFINPVSNRLIEVFREEGVWEQVLGWKVATAQLAPTVDLLQEWPEEMQAWFCDPAHLDFEHSRWVWERLGIMP